MQGQDDAEASGFLSRRGFIKVVAAGAAVWAGGCSQESTLSNEAAQATVTPYITANEDFYLVAVDPTFRPGFGPANVGKRWSLRMAGLTGPERRIDYGTLDAQARGEALFTLECAANPPGGELIGNARWRVLPLRDLLAPMVDEEVGSVMFEGLDGYYSSVSLERAMDDYALLAVGMNGTPLSARHGFPVRVLLPGVYGMKQPRWLHRISLLRQGQTTSYWEKRGWPAPAVRLNSRIDPIGTTAPGRAHALGGIAFGGAHGIAAVEVSLDGGGHWQRCELLSAAAPNVWSVWRYRWDRPTPGRHALEVRAIDTSGRIQSARRTQSGRLGHHTADLFVGS